MTANVDALIRDFGMNYKELVDKEIITYKCDSKGGQATESVSINEAMKITDELAEKFEKKGREERVKFYGLPVTVHDSKVHHDCPPDSNRVIAPAGPCLGRGREPAEVAREEHGISLPCVMSITIHFQPRLNLRK